MYKNIDEEMKAGKRFSANISIACIIMLCLALIIGYVVGRAEQYNIEVIENFNEYYNVEE